MRKAIFITTLSLSISIVGCSNTNADNLPESTTLNSQEEHPSVNKDISAKEFKELITAKEGQILDVRTPKEWNKGVIKGAIKMNYYDNDFKGQLTKLDKNKPVYVYCKAGGRSSKTIYNLDGGMSAWNKANYETVK